MKIVRKGDGRVYIPFSEISVGDTFKSTCQDDDDDTEVYMKIANQSNPCKNNVILLNNGVTFPSSDFGYSSKLYLVNGTFVIE